MTADLNIGGIGKFVQELNIDTVSICFQAKKKKQYFSPVYSSFDSDGRCLLTNIDYKHHIIEFVKELKSAT